MASGASFAKTLGAALALSLLAAPSPVWRGAERIDAVVRDALERGAAPGAVVWVESQGERLHVASYGSRSLVPEREAMTPETVFDCASLTKVLATAPAIMMLVEEGKVRLNDGIRQYLPEHRADERITVEQLLTHRSGLRPTLDLEPAWSGYAAGVELALRETPVQPPGSKFVYSDINYVLLAEIARRVSGAPLDEFAAARIFEPLGMRDTTFRPAAALRGRIAPTVRLASGAVLRGVVHDPTTRAMGGVSGQAGLFSTAADIARFARMMLKGGVLDGVRVLSPLSVTRMTTPRGSGDSAQRGLGWDIDTPYSSPRGDLFSVASYGHTGYTGTSLWIDPASGTFVILLTNRVHPADAGSVVRLRSTVASVAAANLKVPPAARALPPAVRRSRPVPNNVRTGLDVLVARNFDLLRGKRIGLVSNHTGIDRRRRRNIDLFAQAADVKLQVVMTPEHGLGGTLDQPEIADGIDPDTGIEVYSLYRRDRRRPPTDRLRGLEALVFDIQDIGARPYTYITTMGYAMEAAAEAGIEFIVLDRPNPINGATVEGPVLEKGLQSFVGYHSLALRHGMTVGELAGMFNEERDIGANLTVVRMEGWNRGLWFDETGLPWVNPSPNIRNLEQAILYPGLVMLERLDRFSVGRGTDTPFQFVGADWIDGTELADALRRQEIPGIRAYGREERPRASAFEGRAIGGTQLSLVDRDALRSTHLGLAIAAALLSLYPDQVDFSRSEQLIGNLGVIEELKAGRDAWTIGDRLAPALEQFLERRARFLLY